MSTLIVDAIKSKTLAPTSENLAIGEVGRRQEERL
jgi:hypothetical protein